MSDNDEATAYQNTRAWLEQSPPGFLYPKVVPSIVNLRDLILEPLSPLGEEEIISLCTRGKVKQVLTTALEGLEGLDKEEANLVYASPWTVPLTQIVTYQAAASPQQALEQLQACASISPRKVCQYPFKKNDIVWMCRTCQADETCAMYVSTCAMYVSTCVLWTNVLYRSAKNEDVTGCLVVPVAVLGVGISPDSLHLCLFT